MRSFLPYAFLCASAALSCTASNDQTSPLPTFPCEIRQVLSDRCWKCHSSPPAPGVPFALVDFDDTRKMTMLTDSGKPAPIWQAMHEVISEDRMPLSDVTFMPVPLAGTERDVMLAWLEKGAPSGTGGGQCP